MSNECSTCCEKYDLLEHLPKKTECPHTICLACVKKVINESGAFKCPSCNNIDTRDIDEFINDDLIYQQLANNIFPCYKCNSQTAKGIDSKSFLAYCTLCGGSEQQINTIAFNLDKSIYQEYNQYKHLFSFEFKNYIKQTLTKSNNLKLELLHIIKLYTICQTSCYVHPNNSFYGLKLYWFKTMCQNCELDQVLKIDVDINSLFHIFKLYFETAMERGLLAYGSVLNYFYQWNITNYWVPFIEAYLMIDRNFKKVSSLSCMFCKKGFGLGSRMPYKMDCEHYICKSCVLKKPCCFYCKRVSYSYKVVADSSLYIIPKCINCAQVIKMGYSNLPMHYYCDCIICANCSSHVNHCGNCINGSLKISKYNLKVKKSALRTLKYLEIDLKCWYCNTYPSTCFSETYKQVLCEICSQNCMNKFPLKSNHGFDSYLINEYGPYFDVNFPNLYFGSQNLNMKLSLISQVWTNKSRNDSTYLNSELEEIDRFTLIYPISDNDPRSLQINENHEFFLEFSVNVNIKICGFKLAGSIHFKRINANILLLNVQNNILEKKEVEIKSKIEYVMLDQAHEINYYRVLVTYSQAGSIFTGKLRTTNIIQKDDIIFTFNDATGKGGEFNGPILGIIYSK